MHKIFVDICVTDACRLSVSHQYIHQSQRLPHHGYQFIYCSVGHYRKGNLVCGVLRGKSIKSKIYI